MWSNLFPKIAKSHAKTTQPEFQPQGRKTIVARFLQQQLVSSRKPIKRSSQNISETPAHEQSVRTYDRYRIIDQNHDNRRMRSAQFMLHRYSAHCTIQWTTQQTACRRFLVSHLSIFPWLVSLHYDLFASLITAVRPIQNRTLRFTVSNIYRRRLVQRGSPNQFISPKAEPRVKAYPGTSLRRQCAVWFTRRKRRVSRFR